MKAIFLTLLNIAKCTVSEKVQVADVMKDIKGAEAA